MSNAEHGDYDMPEDLKLRYLAAMHGMQSGVTAEMALGLSNAHEPKHLRVGVNAALSDQGSLARLLMRKGVITEREYYEAIVEGAELEWRAYEQRLGAKLA